MKNVVVTGGATAAAGSSLATAALVVTGVDLTLEITEDSAYMAYGNNNKITAIARSARKITEPIAAVLSITQIPNNLVKGIDKVNAVMFGVEQFSEAVQEGKVIGVNLSDLVDKEKSSSLPVTVKKDDAIYDMEFRTFYDSDTMFYNYILKCKTKNYKIWIGL